MATQNITLPAPLSVAESGVFWFNLSVSLIPGLSEVGATNRVLQTFVLFTSGTSTIGITSAPVTALQGEFTEAWEQAEDAVRLSVSGLDDLVLPGPDVPTNQRRDSSGGNYGYTPAAAKQTELVSWIRAYAALSEPRPSVILTFKGVSEIEIPDSAGTIATASTSKFKRNSDLKLAGVETLDLAFAEGIELKKAKRINGAESVGTSQIGVFNLRKALVARGNGTVDFTGAGEVGLHEQLRVRSNRREGRIRTRANGEFGVHEQLAFEGAGDFSIAGAAEVEKLPGNPEAPTDLQQVDQTRQTVTVRFSEPPNTDIKPAIIRYEFRLNGGSWGTLGTSGTEAIISGLNAGQNYFLELRAVNAAGNGAVSEGIAIRPALPIRPGPARHVRVKPEGGFSCIEVKWQPPVDDGGSPVTRYLIDIEGELPEEVDGDTLSFLVHGLLVGRRYGVQVIAENLVGQGPASPMAYGSPEVMSTVPSPAGQKVPLLNVDRQSLIIRIDDTDCRLTVWYQPASPGWYADLEAPAGTPIVQGVRLAVGTGILERIPNPLNSDLVMVASGQGSPEPGTAPWGTTHDLVVT